MRVEREHVLAFRLTGHHLDVRLREGSLLEAVAACGVREAQGSALLALSARLAGVTGDDLRRALAEERTLVEVYGARRTQTLVPARDLAVFTLGAMPSDDESLRSVLEPIVPALDEAGMTAEQGLALAGGIAHEALASGPLSRGALSAEMTRRLPQVLSPFCRGRCRSRHVEEILFRLALARGACCIEPESGSFVRADRWVGGAPDQSRRREARAELIRRYLHCHGPSTAAEFAEWAGISRADASRSFDDLERELVEVRVGEKRRASLLERDAARLAKPPEPRSARLLPPNDPYLETRDRATLVLDRTRQQRLWRATANPGAVLYAGELVGTWRPKKQGKRLLVRLEPFGRLPKGARAAVEEEARALAIHRGCATAEVVVGSEHVPSLM